VQAAFFFFTLFGSSVWIVYLLVNAIRTRQQMRLASDFYSKLLERIGSARELGELLNTEGGRSLLQTLVIDHAPAAAQRILRAAQFGTVLVTVGIGTWLAVMFAVRDWPGEVRSSVFVIASVVVATGAGLLLSAMVSHSLARKLGLLDRAERTSANAIP
jgi:hypothetical protein